MRRREKRQQSEANPTPDPILERHDRLDNGDLVEGSEGGGTAALGNLERRRKKLGKARERQAKRKSA